MSATNNDCPAFPVQDASKWQAHGMTLRDYFAAKAMQGMAASFVNVVKADLPNFLRDMPGIAYELADAMLKAREAQQ